MMLSSEKDVREQVKKAKMYLYISAALSMIFVVILTVLVLKRNLEEGSSFGKLLTSVTCMSILIIVNSVSILTCFRSIWKIEKATGKNQILSALIKAEKNLQFLLLLFIFTFQILAFVCVLISYRTVRKTIDAVINIPSETQIDAPPRPAHSERRFSPEDAPPPGVDYWEWKERHGYWARKGRKRDEEAR